MIRQSFSAFALGGAISSLHSDRHAHWTLALSESKLIFRLWCLCFSVSCQRLTSRIWRKGVYSGRFALSSAEPKFWFMPEPFIKLLIWSGATIIHFVSYRKIKEPEKLLLFLKENIFKMFLKDGGNWSHLCHTASHHLACKELSINVYCTN